MGGIFAGLGNRRTMRKVPAYRISSSLYDRLVGLCLHENWRENFERLERRYDLDLTRVADVACGTGLITEYLAERGSEVFGIDNSLGVLRVAASRLRGKKGVILLRQDICHLSLPCRVDTVICATDSLNHLLREEDVILALASFRRVLREGGRLLFDVNTAWQLREGQDDREWTFRVEGWRCRWTSEWDEDTATATLTMVLEENGEPGGGRWMEVHRERAYPTPWLVSKLQEIGFGEVEVMDAASLGKPGERTRRLQWVAVKRR